MPLRIAINGYGRIGRNFLRVFFQNYRQLHQTLEIVAINDLGNPESLAHLTEFDTTHGRFDAEIKLDGKQLIVNDIAIALFSEPDPSVLPWLEKNIDIVLECTGVFRSRCDAEKHLEAGAKKVVIGAVAFDEVDNTIVYGVNHHQLRETDKIISSASCTTHCIASLLYVLEECFGIETVLMTEIHAYTSDQSLLDRTHRDLRRARAGAQNLIPTTSSSIGAIQRVLPVLAGKIDGYSMRVPTINVAAVDLNLKLKSRVTADEINHAIKCASKKQFKNIIAYNSRPLVSIDFCGRSESAIFDATQTKTIGNLTKVIAWYDNEWAYVNRLIDLFQEL